MRGQIPAALRGTYIRNGPNAVFAPRPHHWFDGDGMLHKVFIESGRASYSNKFVQTEGLLLERATGKTLYGGLLAGPPFKNVANISVVQHHGRTLASWEGGLPYEFNPEDLSTVGLYNFGGQWPHNFTAHPKVTNGSGEMHFFGYDIVPPFLRYGTLNAAGILVHQTEIAIRFPIMMHDFAITENYAIFLELPLIFSTDGLKFQPELGARIGILAHGRPGSEARWFAIEPCWIYHVFNAYEDEEEIVLRAGRCPSWPVGTESAYEWRFHLRTGSVQERSIDLTPSRFPVINPKYSGLKNRYGYAGRDGKVEVNGIMKFDFEQDRLTVYDLAEGQSAGESVFVEDPDRNFEDGGWLLNFVYDEKTSTSELIIIDAESMNFVAAIAMPRRVPFGLHGLWLGKR